MKILVLGTRGIPNIQGGVETHCQELYPRLVKLGCEVKLFTRTPYVSKPDDSFNGVKLIHLYAPKQKSIEAIIHTLLGIIVARFLNPDILHMHAIGPSLLTPIARAIGLKVVVTNHGSDYDRAKWGKNAKRILKLGEKLGTRFANRVIVISNTIKEALEQEYQRNDLILIPNGVNKAQKSTSTDYIKSLGLEKKNYFVAVGRFVPEKGFHNLIGAFAKISSANAKLVLVGDADHETDYSKNLKHLAKKHDVILTGYIKGNNFQETLTHAALFIMPSFHEGLPIALLEALSYDLDVLVSNIAANKEIGLDENCYFDPNDISELLGKLQLKLQDTEMNFNKQSLDHLLSKYNWDKIAQDTLRAYKCIVQ